MWPLPAYSKYTPFPSPIGESLFQIIYIPPFVCGVIVSVPYRGIIISNRSKCHENEKSRNCFRPLSGNHYFKCVRPLVVVEYGNGRFRPLSGNHYFKSGTGSTSTGSRVQFPSPIGESLFQITFQHRAYCSRYISFPSPIGESLFQILSHASLYLSLLSWSFAWESFFYIFFEYLIVSNPAESQYFQGAWEKFYRCFIFSILHIPI